MRNDNLIRGKTIAVQYTYILIRCPAQPNIKHSSCNKQPLVGSTCQHERRGGRMTRMNTTDDNAIYIPTPR